ncbi:MAG: hypothetical protein HY518_00875 [Candidatus Aenigmarchaeota archaeon]|nr:hypothetical protein [Candidatus Aenigmarchaeota archaeon]
MASYYRERDIEELYRFERKERDVRPVFKNENLIVEAEPKKVKVISRRAMPRLEDEEIEPLKLMAPKVIGNLFDRVGFLRERINEVASSMKFRETLHKDMVAEIDVDIQEKMSMESRVADIDEKRNLKLDISVLRKEKRSEGVRFWKDLMELRTELRELLEQYQTESKIAKIFGSGIEKEE